MFYISIYIVNFDFPSKSVGGYENANVTNIVTNELINPLLLATKTKRN